MTGINPEGIIDTTVVTQSGARAIINFLNQPQMAQAVMNKNVSLVESVIHSTFDPATTTGSAAVSIIQYLDASGTTAQQMRDVMRQLSAIAKQ